MPGPRGMPNLSHCCAKYSLFPIYLDCVNNCRTHRMSLTHFVVILEKNFVTHEYWFYEDDFSLFDFSEIDRAMPKNRLNAKRMV